MKQSQNVCVNDVRVMFDKYQQRFAAQGETLANGPCLVDFGIDGMPIQNRLYSPYVVQGMNNGSLPKIADSFQLNSSKTASRASSATWTSNGGATKPMQNLGFVYNSSKRDVLNEKDAINEIRNLLAKQNGSAKNSGIGIASEVLARDAIASSDNAALNSQSVYSFSLQTKPFQNQQSESLLDMKCLQKPLTEEFEGDTVDLHRPKSRRSKSKKSKNQKSAKQRKQVTSFKNNGIKTRTTLSMNSFMIIKGTGSQTQSTNSLSSTKSAPKAQIPVTNSQPSTPRGPISNPNTPRKSVNSLRTSQEEFSQRLAAAIGNNKTTKVYCSEKLSGNIFTEGVFVPCAPPVTPIPDVLKKYEYIPSLADIKAQRLLRLKLQTIEKTLKKKQEKVRKDKIKQDELRVKEQEKMKRRRQRQEIYALNAVMTKLEYERFLEYCKSHDISPK